MRWFSTESPPSHSSDKSSNDSTTRPNQSYFSSLKSLTLHDFTHPRILIPTLVLTTILLTTTRFYTSRLRRIPNIAHLPATHFRHRSLLGSVTSIGDADNFRIYHTPGGRLLLWSLPAPFSRLRRIPTDRKDLHDQTLHIRLAGIDAPELAHFGHPAQPYGKEALEWLKSVLEGQRVRVYVHRRDQYERVVATVYVRPRFAIWRSDESAPRSLGGVPFLRRDVGLEMLKAGWATVYEAKQGAEFGGKEAEYRAAEREAKMAGRGMWGGMGEMPSWWARWVLGRKTGKAEVLESPRDYKTRMKALEMEQKNNRDTRTQKDRSQGM